MRTVRVARRLYTESADVPKRQRMHTLALAEASVAIGSSCRPMLP